MKTSKTTKIGIVLAISTIVLIWGINFLKGRDIFRTEKVYVARYRNVGGLEPSTIVQLNGLKIGYVRDIYFAEDYSGDLIVKIAVFNKFPLPKGTTAEIVSSDMLGSKVIRLVMGDSKEFYHTNDTLPTKVEKDFMTQMTEQIAPVKEKAENLFVSLDSIVTNLTLVLNSESRKNIETSLYQISETVKNLEQMSGDLSQVIHEQKSNLSSTISNLHQMTETLNENADKLDLIMSDFAEISKSVDPVVLRNTIDNMHKSMAAVQSVLTKIEKGEGSAGMLVNDSSLYQNLEAATLNLNRLLIDAKQNPGRYIKFSAFNFGKEEYLYPKESYVPMENIVYKVFLCSSETPISRNSSLFKELDKVTEEKISNQYFYFSGSSNSYELIREILNKTQLSFPQASIKAFDNGNEISLKKALKISSR